VGGIGKNDHPTVEQILDHSFRQAVLFAVAPVSFIPVEVFDLTAHGKTIRSYIQIGKRAPS
jgi:hypothetical protein